MYKHPWTSLSWGRWNHNLRVLSYRVQATEPYYKSLI